MKAIEKQIQASEKRIAKFEKNIATYSGRVDKQLEKLQNKGFMVTREDFPVEKEKGWKYSYEVKVSDRAKEMLTFDQWYGIADNAERERENTDRLADERLHLEELVNENNRRNEAQQADEAKDSALLEKLNGVFQPFKGEWMDWMINWHDAFYDRIHAQLPAAKIAYRELGEEYNRLMHQNMFRSPTPEMRTIEEKRKAYGRILSAPPAAWPTKQGYLDNLRPKLEEEFDTSVRNLATKCRDFNLDMEKLRIHHPSMSERGMDVYMTDGKERVVDARMIWAAEQSELVTAHTRYIVTERHTPQALELHQAETVEQENVNQEQVNMEQEQLDWKEKIDWKEYGQMLERFLASERLLEAGCKEEYNPHPANIVDLEEELQWVADEDYDRVIDHHIGEKGKEDALSYFERYFENEYQIKPAPKPGTEIVDNDGKYVTIADMQMLEDKLKEQYPDGLVIPLPDESLAHLMDIQEAVDLGIEHMLDAVTFAGQIEDSNLRWVPEGTLKAELRLSPEMYGRIYPNEEVYDLSAPHADRMDWEDRAATGLLHEKGDNLKGAEVEVTIREDIMSHLYIEGRPWSEVLYEARRSGCISDMEVKELFALQQIHQQGLQKKEDLPECLNDLMLCVFEKYRDKEMTPAVQQEMASEIMTRTEFLLMRIKALPVEMHNVVAVMDTEHDNQAAKDLTMIINSTYAADNIYAYRQDNRVEISIQDLNEKRQAEIHGLLRNDPYCQDVDRMPFRSMDTAHTAYVLCENGQLLRGHLGMEGLNRSNHYGLAKPDEGVRQVQHLLPAPGTEKGMLFSTDDTVRRFHRTFKGQMMPVAYCVSMDDIQKTRVINDTSVLVSHDADRKIDKTMVCGWVEGFPYRQHELSEEDTRLFNRFISNNESEADRKIVGRIFLAKYFKQELDIAWQKEQGLCQQLVQQKEEHEKQLARITEPRLYGKVDNIHIRCKIDGEQQMGRPLAKEDLHHAKSLSETAATLGKDTLNYHNWFHESIVKEMAAHAFKDVLNQEMSREQDRGIRR